MFFGIRKKPKYGGTPETSTVRGGRRGKAAEMAQLLRHKDRASEDCNGDCAAFYFWSCHDNGSSFFSYMNRIKLCASVQIFVCAAETTCYIIDDVKII